MKTIQLLRTTTATAAISSALISPSFAEDNATLAFASEVDSCIAAVNANLDLQNANRVRHVVKQQQRAGHAYAFEIETSVFTEDAEVHYAAYCVASGNEAPFRFRIAQKSS